ncbi:MAG: DUF4214 domain-containing protein, partial [Epsilonproteobacteria bacterium]|nr:DUF4214 domain-containing protein [Campylobacterota bacterium]
MKKILLIFLSFFIINLQANDIENFITNLYQKILLRSPDKKGLEFYIKALKNGQSATKIAKIFIKSDELKKQ